MKELIHIQLDCMLFGVWESAKLESYFGKNQFNKKLCEKLRVVK